MVIGGSLERGLEVKLNPAFPLEEAHVGSFVAIQGQSSRYFGIISDVSLEASDSSMRSAPPDVDDPFIAQIVSGTGVYGVATVSPQLTLGGDAFENLEGPKPARSIPAHFAPVYLASEEDVSAIFGTDDERHIWIGSPLDMEGTQVCLDLEEFVKRSNGIFGKSGTGKTFLTRILLAGILQKNVAVNLVFDMHSEYGWQGTLEGGSGVKGLKQLFPAQVAVFSLDPESSRRREVSWDVDVKIGYGEIEPEDIEILAEALNITPQGVTAVYALAKKFGQEHWLEKLLGSNGRDEISKLAEDVTENFQVLLTLHRRLRNLSRMGFLQRNLPQVNAVDRILKYLGDGQHVVLEFGRYGNELMAYILVANLLTRRIHQQYVRKTETAMGDRFQEPRPLVITIEEAHRFLTPAVASQTIFGTIAREMRKYKVALLVVDQRPSGIDEEVLSQLGTRMTYLLDNDRDVDAVLSGTSGARELRRVLSRLDSRQQALMFGHALPMPVVVKTREYGTKESYEELGLQSNRAIPKSEGKIDNRDLFG